MHQTPLHDDFLYCWAILPRVSRSFALGISLLSKNLKDAVMVSYLLFRISDTIEDAFLPKRTQVKLLDAFQKILGHPVYHEIAVLRLQASLVKHHFDHEDNLMRHIGPVLHVYFSLPLGVRAIICRWISEMNKHARIYNNKLITTFKEQNIYCYYAAGVVGHLLTDLFSSYGSYSGEKKKQLHALAAAFGLALQKVNIIKDLHKDVQEKRYYWPQTLLKNYGLTYKTLFQAKHFAKASKVLDQMLADALPSLDKAAQYIMLLPKRPLRVRVFCLIALLMAVYSLGEYRRRFHELIQGGEVKMPRKQVLHIVRKSFLYTLSDTFFLSWYRKEKALHLFHTQSL